MLGEERHAASCYAAHHYLVGTRRNETRVSTTINGAMTRSTGLDSLVNPTTTTPNISGSRGSPAPGPRTVDPPRPHENPSARRPPFMRRTAPSLPPRAHSYLAIARHRAPAGVTITLLLGGAPETRLERLIRAHVCRSSFSATAPPPPLPHARDPPTPLLP